MHSKQNNYDVTIGLSIKTKNHTNGLKHIFCASGENEAQAIVAYLAYWRIFSSALLCLLVHLRSGLHCESANC